MSINAGSIQAIKSGNNSVQPILQVVSLQAKVAGHVTKYIVTFTDGILEIKGMPMSQLSPLFQSQQIKELSIVKLLAFSLVPGQEMLMISSMELVEQGTQLPKGFAPNPQIIPQQSYTPQPTYGAPQQAYAPPQQAYAPPQQTYGTPKQSNSAPQSTYGVPQPYKPPQQSNSYAPPQAPPTYGNYQNSYGNSNQSVAQQPPYGNSNVKPEINGYGASSNPYGLNPNPYASSGNRPVARQDDLEHSVIPINGLNPYANKWTIKAKITNKSQIRTWSNAKGQGQLFSIDLVDNQGTEIRATFFNDAATKWYGVLEEGKVYLMSSGKIKVVANKAFTHIKNNYEITFDANSDIQPSEDSSIRGQPYKFVPISNLTNVDPNEHVDIIGIVKNATDVSEISIAKQGGKVTHKRELTVIDQTGSEVRLTLWGDKAQNASYPWNNLPIVAFRAVKVSDYGGRSLGSTMTTGIAFDPQIPETYELHRWRSQFNGAVPEGVSMSSGGGSSGGGGSINEPFENRKSIAAIKDDGLGLGEKADFVVVKGVVNYIKHDTDPWYKACPTCNKKVSEAMNGYFCEKCSKQLDHAEHRYILSCTIADSTGNTWVTIFSDEATKLLGIDANSLSDLKNSDIDAYENVFSKALFQTVVTKIRVKQEMVNNESRIKSTVLNLSKADYVQESRLMLDAINKYQSM